jgi:hypothetical protein
VLAAVCGLVRPGVTALFLLWAPAAMAQVNENPVATAVEDSVVNRPRPEYDPIGFSPGMLVNGGHEPRGQGVASVLDSFNLFPSMAVESYYTDNVFQTSVRRADLTTLFQPGLELRSDWDNHEFKLGMSGTATREIANPTANSTDYEIHASTRLDIDDGQFSDLALSHSQNHEVNSILVNTVAAGTFNQGTKPIIYEDDNAKLDWTYQPSDILLRGDATARHLYFNNRAEPPTDQLLIESNQNRWEYDGHFRVGYEAFESTILFVEPGVSVRRYDSSPTDFPQLAGTIEDRNSNGGQVLAGLTYNASSVAFLDFGIGYIEREFTNPSLPRVSGPAVRGALTWNPTELITVGASLNRDIVESTTLGVAGFFRTAAHLSVDYEYDYNVILGSALDYAREDAVATPGFEQRIKDLHAIVSATYLINEYAKAQAGYRYEDLASTIATQSFRENQIFLRLNLFY